MFTDGTDDFYEQLLESRKIILNNENLRDNLSCTDSSDLEKIVKAQKEKECLGCVPWGKIYTCEEMEKYKEKPVSIAYQRIFGEYAKYLQENYKNLNKVCCSKRW